MGNMQSQSNNVGHTAIISGGSNNQVIQGDIIDNRGGGNVIINRTYPTPPAPLEPSSLSVDTIHQIAEQVTGRIESSMQQITPVFLTIEKRQQIAQTAKKRLGDAYMQHEKIQGVFGPPFPLDEQYIHLELVYYARTSDATPSAPDEQKPDLFPAPPKRDLEASCLKKRALTLNQLFVPASTFLDKKEYTDKEDRDKEPSLVWLRGDPGYGKTTSVRFMSRLWAKGKLWPKFKWVFLFTLRDLPKGGNEDWDMCDWVYAQYYKGGLETINKYELRVFWKADIKPLIDQKKVLFILDGRDELASDSPFRKMILALETDHIPTLISSRPHGVSPNSSKPDVRVVEVVGFVDENVENYIRFYWGESNRAQAQVVIEKIRQRPIIWNTAHVPVLLNALCGVIHPQKQERDIDALLQNFKSLTDVYEWMEFALLEKPYFKEKGAAALMNQSLKTRKGILQEHYRKERDLLAHLAFSAFVENKLIISDRLLENSLRADRNIEEVSYGAFRKKLLDLGLLKLVGDSYPNNVSAQRYEFLHLTLQEYYASHYVAWAISDNTSVKDVVDRTIASGILDPRYEKVWCFVAGKLRGKEYKAFFDCIRTNGDLIGHYTLSLRVRCVEEILGTGTHWEDEESLRKILIRSVRSEVQGRLAQLWQEFKARRIDVKSPIPIFAYALQDCLNWLEMKEDIFVSIEPSEKNSGLFANFLVWLQLITPRVTSWVVGHILWDGFVRDLNIKKKLMESMSFTNTLIQGLSDGNGNCAYAIGELGREILLKDSRVVPALVQGLSNSNKKVRQACAEAIGKLGPEVLKDSCVVPALLQALAVSNDCRQIDDSQVRKACIDVIGKLVPEILKDSRVVPALINDLSDLSEKKSTACAEVIGKLGSQVLQDDSIVPALVQGLSNSNKRARQACAEAIGNLGSETLKDGSVVPALIRGLSDGDWHVKAVCAGAIGNLGPEVLKDSSVLPALRQGLTTYFGRWGEGQHVRQACALAIGNLGPEVLKDSSVLLVLINGLLTEYYVSSDGSPDNAEAFVVGACAEAIGNLGPEVLKDSSVLPALVQWLIREREGSSVIKRACAEAIGKLGPEVLQDSRVVPALIRRLNYGSYADVGWSCAKTLTLLCAHNFLRQAKIIQQKNDSTLLLGLLIGAYLSGKISLRIVREDIEGGMQGSYNLEGYIQQDPFVIALSPQQAQWLCHFAPEAIKLMQQGHWSWLTVDYLERNRIWDSLGLFSKLKMRPALSAPADDPKIRELPTRSRVAQGM